jgi:hypothetical protein
MIFEALSGVACNAIALIVLNSQTITAFHISELTAFVIEFEPQLRIISALTKQSVCGAATHSVAI